MYETGGTVCVRSNSRQDVVGLRQDEYSTDNAALNSLTLV